MKKIALYILSALFAFAGFSAFADYDDMATEGYVEYWVTNNYGATNFSIAVRNVYENELKADPNRIVNFGGDIFLDATGRVWKIEKVYDDAWVMGGEYNGGSYNGTYARDTTSSGVSNYKLAYSLNSNFLLKSKLDNSWTFRLQTVGGSGFALAVVNEYRLEYESVYFDRAFHFETNLVGRAVSKADINADEEDPQFTSWRDNVAETNFVNTTGDTITGDMRFKDNVTIDGEGEATDAVDLFSRLRAYGVTSRNGNTVTYGYKTLYDWALQKFNSPELLLNTLIAYSSGLIVGNTTNRLATTAGATNIAETLIREITPDYGTLRLRDAADNRWFGVDGEVYQASCPLYWKLTYNGLTYALKTNDGNTWRNVDSEYPQIVYADGKWTAYSPQGVSIGYVSNQTGEETSITATNWSAKKDNWWETNKVDQVVFSAELMRNVKIEGNTITIFGREITPLTDSVVEGKQDTLPYPTNAIPYSVIVDVPTIDSTKLKTEDGLIWQDATGCVWKVTVTTNSGGDVVGGSFASGSYNGEPFTYQGDNTWKTSVVNVYPIGNIFFKLVFENENWILYRCYEDNTYNVLNTVAGTANDTSVVLDSSHTIVRTGYTITEQSLSYSTNAVKHVIYDDTLTNAVNSVKDLYYDRGFQCTWESDWNNGVWKFSCVTNTNISNL